MKFKFLILYLFTVNLFFSQIKKGDKLFNKGQITAAIKKYIKATQSTNTIEKQTAYTKLAEAYQAINDYENAEITFKKALNFSNNNAPELYNNYAQVLKINGKYAEAATYFKKYLATNQNDANAKNALKYCEQIKYYSSKPIEYTIKNLQNINSAKSEFSPFVFNNKLMFVAERSEFNFVDFTVNDYNGEPYLNMYVSDLKNNDTKNTKSFSTKINTAYHDGPACLSADGKTLYFTRTTNKRKKNYVNQAKIFYSIGSGRSWKNTQAFTYNSDNYSVAHPSLSEDGNVLYFSSNMPNGYGGKDIWFCKREGDAWGKPINCGPDINTPGDEMFPYIHKNNQLFFSSNGLPGFGGLDIYSAKLIANKWILNRNEGLNLNSSYDDFSICFLNDSIGYFSSNRIGGKGKDDIYRFTFQNKFTSLSGTVLLTEKTSEPAVGVKVLLSDNNSGLIIDSVKTNDKGFFEFKNLETDKKYMATITSDDPKYEGKARYYLADKNGEVKKVSSKTGNNKFTFKNLPLDPNALPDIYTDDDLTLAGNLLYGENPSKPLKNSKLKLVNEHGDVIEETQTNEFGAFAFRKIPTDQNYLISLEESDITLPENTKITLTNKSGKELKTFFTGKDKFNFKVINTDKVLMNEMNANDEDLIMDIFGYMYDQNKKPIVGARIKMLSDGNTETITSGDKGKFNFKNLRADKNYMFEADINDPIYKDVQRIYIADAHGVIYKIIERTGDGKFTFKVLPIDKTAMGDFVVDDPWLQVLEMKEKEKKELTIIENIYYASNEFKLDESGIKILDKVISVLNTNQQLFIEISSHTDSKASDSYNLTLSKKRAQFAVDYIVSKGINKNRLSAIGYGETKLLNHCKNDVPCSDDEHKVNRRTEFKISEKVFKN
ncbi:MAG: OmpA family protein [Bacteroidetes bacterium]|nr:OmpA family protein [Bacteroidota bacterium]